MEGGPFFKSYPFVFIEAQLIAVADRKASWSAEERSAISMEVTRSESSNRFSGSSAKAATIFCPRHGFRPASYRLAWA
jgi:hypothetical protein